MVLHNNMNTLATLLLLCVWSLEPCCCLRLLGANIPTHANRGKSARLECKFDLDGDDLYTVKWYKDGNEFYRYVPRNNPPGKTFNVHGVHVALENSTESVVTLNPVTLASSGRYQCEISAESPSFETVTDFGSIIVIAMPEMGPRISGGQSSYHIGDIVRVNCTSGKSKPSTQLAWFINGEMADHRFLRGPHRFVTGRESLETTILGLEFKVKPRHFLRNRDLKLKCVAKMSTGYMHSNEEIIEGLPRRFHKHQTFIESNHVHDLNSHTPDTMRNYVGGFAAANSARMLQTNKYIPPLLCILFGSIAKSS